MKKTGTVQCMNISPKGFYEGFLLLSGKNIVQINLPKEHLQSFADGLTSGRKISLEVEHEEPWGEPSHKVFRLVRVLDTTRGKAKKESNARRKFRGTIERLNYALHGEVNGGILDSGHFLHLKPEGARKVGLSLGMLVEARGETRPMQDGHFVIEADQVNGIAIEHHKAKKKHGR